MIIKEKAYARAGLIGNPSDGYFGKTISFRIANYSAEVVLYETPDIEILPTERDHCAYSDINSLVCDIKRFDYYGGIRLVKAAIKKFADYCSVNRLQLSNRNFTIRYSSTIPQHVGMAGSSAIITATIFALMKFYGIPIAKELLPNLILSVETDELKLAAGLQDRVIQVYGGLVYMDFNKKIMESTGHGLYESLPLSNLPNLYVAFRQDLAEVSDRVHSDLKSRYDNGDPVVHEAMRFFAAITDKARDVLSGKSNEDLGSLMNANFDKRREIMQISESNMDMVVSARSVGATAKFTGSGGAITGTYKNEQMYNELCRVFEKNKIVVFKPEII